MLDTFLWIRTSAGLEAFSSPRTAAAALKYSGSQTEAKYLEQLPNLCRSRFGFQWLGLGIDQWSVGCCGTNMLRYGLRLFAEPLYDGLHGIHRDIFRAMSLASVWIYFLCMKLLYSYNYGPWNGGKHLVEGAEIIKELYASPTTKREIRKLWFDLWPDMCRDEGKLELIHDSEKCEAEFEQFPSSSLMTSKGPRMTICGWMSYKRGFQHWDPKHTRRTFFLTLVNWKRGTLIGALKGVTWQTVKCAKVFKAAEPGMTKKAQEKNVGDLRALGANIAASMGIIHGQGWFLQRRIRMHTPSPH